LITEGRKEGRKVKEIPSKRGKKKQNKTIDKTRQDREKERGV
jgi:hypothetical protein